MMEVYWMMTNYRANQWIVNIRLILGIIFNKEQPRILNKEQPRILKYDIEQWKVS